MPYSQQWGISRNAFQSPLSYGGIGKYVPKPKKKEEEEEILVEEEPIDISDDAEKDIIIQNNEKAQSETRSSLDKFQDLLTLGGFAPGVFGAGIDLINTGIYGARSLYSLAKGDKDTAAKHAKSAVVSGFSSVPGIGDVWAAGNATKKAVDIVSKGSNTYKAMKATSFYKKGEAVASLVSDGDQDKTSKKRVISSGDPRTISTSHGFYSKPTNYGI